MKTVVISGARSLPALRLARALALAGARVVATDSIRYATAGASSASQRYVRTHSPKRETPLFYQDVARLLDEEKPDLWIPTYEEVFYLARGRETHFPGIPLFAPSFQQLAQVHDKARFAAFAAKLGMAPAETHHLTNGDGIHALSRRSREFVFKPVWSRGGGRVLIQPGAEALAAIYPTQEDPWIAQTCLPGEEICTFSIAQHGRLLAHVAYRPYYRPGPGPAIAFQQVDGVETKSFVEAFVETTAWHGQLSFDMRRDESGRLLPMECNPRVTSGVHFLTLANLGAAFSGSQVITEIDPQLSIIGLAMLTYGLPSSMGRKGFSNFMAEWMSGKDVIWDRSDPGPSLQQFPFTVETALLALRRKISMHAAFTDDIEWDGTPLE